MHLLPAAIHCPDTTSLLAQLQSILPASEQVVILTDDRVAIHCLPLLLTGDGPLDGAEIIELEAGEQSKNLDICAQVWSHLLERALPRQSTLVCIGGGVVTDLGAFIAATYKRGIHAVHIPTSLLGMVDASIGGKTGIDHDGFKNVIGTFSAPRAVLVCPEFLKTLPGEEVRSGFAEMVKHALVADGELWKLLRHVEAITAEDVAPYIPSNVRIKEGIVREDPTEQGRRALLNFGHTVGHAIESFFLAHGKPLSHGHAVGLGMMVETALSVSHAGLSPTSAREILSRLRHWFPLPDGMPAPVALLPLLLQDKKNKGDGSIRSSLISAPGVGVTGIAAKEEDLTSAWEEAFSV